jgi:CRP/FNR family transcriptional regulator, cyclic AMP receptor protein
MARVSKEVLEHFASIPLFARVSRRGLRAIATEADEFTVASGKAVVTEGEVGRHLYVVADGTVKVTRKGRKIATMGAGDFFGEMALIQHAPRNATVVAETETTLMALGSREFAALMAREPSVASAVMEAMADRIRAAEKSIGH